MVCIRNIRWIDDNAKAETGANPQEDAVMKPQNTVNQSQALTNLMPRTLGGLRRLYRQLRRWWQLAEQRRQLAMLDESALKDIGLSRADAWQESERPFWDDPDSQ